MTKTNNNKNADFVTVLKLSSRANKLIQRDKSGKLSKQAGPPITNAIGRTIYVPDCKAMASLISEVADDPNATIIPGGYFPGTLPIGDIRLAGGDDFYISSKKFIANSLGVEIYDTEKLIGWHEINGQRHIARIKANMLPTTWMLFDRDDVKGMPDKLATMPDDEWFSAMSSMVPGLDKIQVVKVPSSTGRILVDGEPMSASGRHYYIPVADGNDLERFGAILLQRSFLNGYGFMRPIYSRTTPDKVAGRRQWSIFDPTTFSHERLVYEGAPTLKGNGLTLAPSQIEVI
jgi:hypothetical protein